MIQEYKCKFKVDSKYKCLQGTNLISAEQRDRTDRQTATSIRYDRIVCLRGLRSQLTGQIRRDRGRGMTQTQWTRCAFRCLLVLCPLFTGSAGTSAQSRAFVLQHQHQCGLTSHFRPNCEIYGYPTSNQVSELNMHFTQIVFLIEQFKLNSCQQLNSWKYN